ncbi:F0F1 ATP synthase subunit epsilon [SAR202 cluster bacterium AD-804-J14_MRT_500m]|nr:F0F1 ATP synthase subunit epsilon [SAR202 cluster bacterium AD-804-J14_MRT_500m]
MTTMRLEIITAERVIFSDDVDSVQVPGINGELGILPHHAPLMTMIQPGELAINKNGDLTYLAISGGFLEVMANRVQVLADAAERSDEIDEERAKAAVARAQEAIANRGADGDLQRALTQLRRAQTRLGVSRRRRPKAGSQTTASNNP